MDRRWLPLNALRGVRGRRATPEFYRRGDALLISQSALSRHVIALEKLIGVQLFERAPHALVSTKGGSTPARCRDQSPSTAGIRAGRHPQRRHKRAEDAARADAADLRRPSRVSILRDFRHIAPDVEIDLVSPYGVGAPVGEVDVAVVYSKPTVTDMVRDLLWPVRLSMICHPVIAERHKERGLGAFIEANELIHVRLSDLPRHQPVVPVVRDSRGCPA